MKKYSKIVINGIKFFYSYKRIKQADVPEGYYKYSVRMSDDAMGLATIEPMVIVNHEMDLLSEIELNFGEHGYIDILDWSFMDE